MERAWRDTIARGIGATLGRIIDRVGTPESANAPWDDDHSIRAELFSVERLEQHAASLAAAQPVAKRTSRGRPLSGRLRSNAAVLYDAYRGIAAASDAGRAVTPAAEWLLDNYHLVEEQIREISADLPPAFYRQLPKLTTGALTGLPRVLGLAWAFVAHTDSRFDLEALRRFVRAYQRVEPLTIGELWALALTLRIVLVENLRRGAQRMEASRVAREAADALADRLLATDRPGNPSLAAILRSQDAEPVTTAFAVQLVQRLRDQTPEVAPALEWLDARLAEQGTSADESVCDEHQRQGATNVTVRNVIVSMRQVSDLDWPAFVESVSLVDSALSAQSDFAAMDLPTRSMYRSAVESFARGSALSELEIAQAAVVATRGHAGREADPGFHLVGRGRRDFERTIGYRPPIASRFGRFTASIGLGTYIGGVATVALAVLALPMWQIAQGSVAPAGLVLIAVLGAVPALDAAMALMNRGVARGWGAALLPGLALAEGVPESLRTLVAVPILFTTREALDEHLERLEIHYLATPEGAFHFALLSDWTDSDTEFAAGEDALVAAARAGIAALNARHGPAFAADRFVLLHRRRVWSTSQGCWIGRERKRGKLHELNRLLRGATDTTFVGNDAPPFLPPAAPPPGVRFVITLDADTRLPREAARRLVGKMAHPLNQPRFDPREGRVVEGYGVLQPRVTPSLPVGREGSLFQRVFSSMNGIDPYAAAVSDVYQDLFGEGSYTGKGIYDVDAFEAALAGRVPDGTMLSHDLFEGIFARAGLASDVEVVEEFPARYDVASARHHRWVRGDWQLLPWMLGRGADASAGRMPALGRWKMLDNVRRSLSAPASFAALVAGWVLLSPAAAFGWTAFVIATIGLGALLPVLSAIVPRKAAVTAASHLRALFSDVRLGLAVTTFLVIFLAHQAWLMIDAIARTLFRLAVTRRHLLDWVTAAQATVGPRLRLAGFHRLMAGGLGLTTAAVAILAWRTSDTWLVAAPVLALWFAAPSIARWSSLSPLVAGRVATSATDTLALRQVARRTWRYFEAMVTPAQHHLPPDNFQETPTPVVARRTSPTNIGLYLLAAASAREFGWMGTHATANRIADTLATLQRLEKHRGHLLNWYDTGDLRPLEPRYVSSVDSGNLAGHLVALGNACRAWEAEPWATPDRMRTGIGDALALTRLALVALPNDRRALSVRDDHVDAAVAALAELLDLTDDAGLVAALPALAARAGTLVDVVLTLARERDDAPAAEAHFWAEATLLTIEEHARDHAASAKERADLAARLASLAATASDLALAMDFRFLVDPDRLLLSIGFRVSDGMLDPSCYDLLASEARLASFMAIAKGDVSPRHWFRLGRAVTPIRRGAALVSWSGSMFEYLMPALVMRAPAASLLEQTSRLVVQRQIDHGNAHDVPWGVSESAYNVRDLDFTYQYSNFGVPGLGLKRGLGDNMVVAPYATGLAAMVDPAAAAKNYARFERLGALGRFGFREALDYTRTRVPVGEPFAIVRAFMAHHQGMTVVAIANALLDGVMRARFHAEPMVQATELLLQERTPRDVAVAHPRVEKVRAAALPREPGVATVRRLQSPHDATPQTHLLSNGRYAVMLTAAGAGYSRWGEIAITRWRADPTCDDCGTWLFLRDTASGRVWSTGWQPSAVTPDRYDVTFAEDHAEIMRRDGAITTSLEVVVSPEDDAEVRRVSITNTSSRVREIEITSYAELVLTTPAADAAHPAFSKLFVQTEYVAKSGALLATRRRRGPDEPVVWAAHLATVEGESIGPTEVETDRARFIGRGRDMRTAVAVADGRPLSNTTGTVLDPIFSVRRRVRVPPGRTVRIAFWTMVAGSRADILDLVDKHLDSSAFERAATLAWTQAQVQLAHLGIDAERAGLFQRLAGHVLYADPASRPPAATLRRGLGGPEALWAQSISGDVPIVVVRIDDVDDLAIVRQLLGAHEYWRMKQLEIDLVILNERGSSYIQDLQIALETLVRTGRPRPPRGADPSRRAVFVLRSDLVPADTHALLLATARTVLVARGGTLSEQLQRMADRRPRTISPAARPALAHTTASDSTVPAPASLRFFNGLGGFTPDGREYVTILAPGRETPAPWINVIANPEFGFQVAVEGSGYTWSLGSRENQLTPWSNDPVLDRPGEALYVRDDDSGELWGPTAAPIRDPRGTYVARHGQGWSGFEHFARGIALSLRQFVSLDAPVKISHLRIENRSSRTRRLSVTAWVEWVLGPSRARAAHGVVTSMDPGTNAMFASNPCNSTYAGRVAFADLGGRQSAWTGDRREFIGRNGTLAAPAGLAQGVSLSGTTGAGLDPGGALQTVVQLEPGASTELVVLLGQGASAADASALVTRFRSADPEAILAGVKRHWDAVLGKVTVCTPDPAMDLMLNRWLLYQTLACRVYARAAFYQASGAWGFRDQLQDGMALALVAPALTREHLLRAAGRQFVEGDVQHWWLPPTGQGVRTRIADDRIWLAFAVAHYVESVADTAVLDECVPFLEGRPVAAGEHDAYFRPEVAERAAPLYEHCALALDRSLEIGVHGLPLFGTGDWNDGMNRVGEGGRGESVWLAWFLYATLVAFAPVARSRGEAARADSWLKHAAALVVALERDGWDGAWYRRGYFDDGTPLGSAAADECRIDAIAQSWAVLSGAAPPARAAEAMASARTHLIDREYGLALLFTPPFDRTQLDPGYVRGYPPGIRENGGQYTHAAAWSVMAHAALGDGAAATALFAMLIPVNHTRTRADVQRYKVEPYVVAADIYSRAPHAGRGGWTWYTGSAGWMHRAGLESILGLRLRGNMMTMTPCIPPDWPGFSLTLRHDTATYEVTVENPDRVSTGVVRLEVDGATDAVDPPAVRLADDGRVHTVRVVLGRRDAANPQPVAGRTE